MKKFLKEIKFTSLTFKIILFPLHPMKQQNINRVRLYAKPAIRNQNKIKVYGTAALFCISFILASYYSSFDVHLKKCMNKGNTYNYCESIFRG